MLGIQYAKNKKDRTGKYKDLLKVTQHVTVYCQRALDFLEASNSCDFKTLALILENKRYLDLTYKVINQTRRRVIHAEKVAASEKVVSIFEPLAP